MGIETKVLTQVSGLVYLGAQCEWQAFSVWTLLGQSMSGRYDALRAGCRHLLSRRKFLASASWAKVIGIGVLLISEFR